MLTDISTAATVVYNRQEGPTINKPINNRASVAKVANDGRNGQADAAFTQHQLSKEKPIIDDKLKEVVKEMRSYVQNLQRDLQFKIDETLGRTVISVIDSETKEVIRQIPSEDVLRRAQQFSEREQPEGLLLEVEL